MTMFGPPAVEVEVGDQRGLMGYVSGWMYAGVGVIGLFGLAVPALRFHPAWQLGLGLASLLYGLITIVDVVNWKTRPMWMHVSAMAAALPVIALALWATGGSHSYLKPVLLLAPIHWGFFVRQRRMLALLCLGFILMYWTPLLYQADAHRDGRVAITISLSLTIIVIAAALSLIRQRLDAAEEELRELASVDPLTGLLNRRGFRTALHRLVASADAERSTYLILLDLDHLKRLNDTHGHPVGDEALRRFAERLAAGARTGDVVARLGGDEFAVAGHTREPATVDRVASRLEIAVSGDLCGAEGVRIDATTGWSVSDKSAADTPTEAEQLLHAADERLLVNKRNRRATADPVTASPVTQAACADAYAQVGAGASLRS
jgi:diguanylate cyclase (GGDEF)-like protein